MIKSMTGYGLASNDYSHAKYTVEIKSLNSKFLELSLKLPKGFSEKELLLRNECSKLIERGKVNITITAEYPGNTSKGAVINSGLLQAYYNQLKEVAEEVGSATENLLQIAMTFPDVVQYPEETLAEEEWKLLHLTFEQALANFQTFRRDEGSVLQRDIEMRIHHILTSLKQVEAHEPNRLPVIRERLNNYLSEAIGRENIDQNRFEQELIFYIDKLDITEEKIRLKSHCDYFIESLKDKDANGKKLGFISQEIGREVNTLGSKANDANIQQIVVGMKEELEKIKEQLLNVL
ncbi:MAG TPA: YicC/YloC family endoribonuclease [Sphingobacteriaceae bacterium]